MHSLEVDHQAVVVAQRADQLREQEVVVQLAPYQLATVPEHRDRTHGLQMSHLEPTAAYVDVGLDEVYAGFEGFA